MLVWIRLTAHPARSWQVQRIVDIHRPTWRLQSEVLPCLALSLRAEMGPSIPALQTVFNFNKIFSVAGTNFFVAFEAAAGNAAPSPTAASSSPDATNSDLLKAGLEGGVRLSTRAADIAGKKTPRLLGVGTFLWAGAFFLSPLAECRSPLLDRVAGRLRGPLVPLRSGEGGSSQALRVNEGRLR